MICSNNYLADILRVFEIKDLIWVMRFQSPLVYLRLPSITRRRIQNSYTVAKSFTQVNVSETRKLNRNFSLSIGRGKN